MTDAYRIRTDETWAEARADYLSGFTAEEVCRRHDIGLSALRQRARREGWRRADQADPLTAEDDLDVFDDVEAPDLVDMAWRRLAAAVARGRAADAARWQRIHADLLSRAQDEATNDYRDVLNAVHAAEHPAEPRPMPWPRLRPTGEIVHDVHTKVSADEDDADLPRAERRRRLREARRRS
jgi:hypothetical protein